MCPIWSHWILGSFQTELPFRTLSCIFWCVQILVKKSYVIMQISHTFSTSAYVGISLQRFSFLKSTLNKNNNTFSIIFCTLLLMTHRLITHSKNVWMKMKWRFRPIVRSHRRLILRWNRNSHVPWSMIFIFIVS